MRRYLAILAIVAIPQNAQEVRALRLDERCDTLCPMIGKGDHGLGRPDGKCDCITVVDPFYYRDRILQSPRKQKRQSYVDEYWRREF